MILQASTRIFKALEDLDRKEAEARRAEFKRPVKAVARYWPKLRKAVEMIEPVRNKLIAHFEVQYNCKAKAYEPADKTLIRYVRQTIEEVVPIITKSVVHLAGPLKSLDPRMDQLRISIFPIPSWPARCVSTMVGVS